MVGRAPRMPPLAWSLSARLLLLTIAFVMVAEVLIYVPSIARFRLAWFGERIAAAHLASLALEAAPSGMVSKDLERNLLTHVQGYSVILQRPNSKTLMLSIDMPPEFHETVDLNRMSPVDLIVDAFTTLARTENRVLRVMGASPRERNAVVAVLLDETPLREAMYAFSRRIVVLSVVISFFAAALVYLSLQWMMVTPMRRLTASMVAFRENPANPDAAVVESGRGDEIGTAEHELADMQSELRAALRQKDHLAALGEAVAKINHDLRNMLAAARLISERLAQSEDPDVKRATPILERTLDRAVEFCSQTLSYAVDRSDLSMDLFRLAEMLREVGAEVCQWAPDAGAAVRIAIPEDFTVRGDREQLERVFTNLARNAVEAGATEVAVSLVATGPVVIDVADDGPGMPQRAVDNLFKPFSGSTRAGGTGLGLAIAREVMQAHGGTIELVRTGADGTVFRLTFPGRAAPLGAAAQ